MQGFGAKFGADYINQFGVCRGIGICLYNNKITSIINESTLFARILLNTQSYGYHILLHCFLSQWLKDR